MKAKPTLEERLTKHFGRVVTVGDRVSFLHLEAGELNGRRVVFGTRKRSEGTVTKVVLKSDFGGNSWVDMTVKTDDGEVRDNVIPQREKVKLA